MFSKKTLLVSSLILVLFSIIVAGCSSGGRSTENEYATLTGKVVDSSNQPLAGVRVDVGTAVTVYTNANGVFQTGNFTSGTYNVTFSKSGYASQMINVELSGDSEISSSIVLSPAI